MNETLGWIGIGSMGHRMTRHLAAAGHTLVVADALSTERAPPGAKIATSNAEVAALADAIILSLPDGNVSQAVAREIADASPRKVKTVIDTLTIGIKAAEAVAAILAKSGESPSSTPPCRAAPRAPTRPRSPSCWRVRRRPTSA